MNGDVIEIEILPDGSLKIVTPNISMGNHRNADELMKFLAQTMGGEVETTKRKPKHHTQSHHAARQLEI